MKLKDFAGEMNQMPHLITSGKKMKIFEKIESSAMVHFAGHSFATGSKHTSGWQLEDDVLFDLADMEKIGESQTVPWFVFSNSCYAGNSGGSMEASGIAGAFLKAGISQVIGPVKKVNDIDALNFAKTFYGFLFKGMNPSESLLATKQQNMKEGFSNVTPLLYRLYGDPCFSIKGGKNTVFESSNLLIKKQPSFLKIIIMVLLLVAVALLLIYLTSPSGGDNIIYIPAK